MKLQDYKKFITAAFVNNTRREFVDWRDCGDLCMDVIEGLEGAKEGLCAANRAFLINKCWIYYWSIWMEGSLIIWRMESMILSLSILRVKMSL